MCCNAVDLKVLIFVAATYHYMQPERDYLVMVGFPRVRKLCEWSCVVWGDVDLRRVVTQNQVVDGTVSPICCEEIHISRLFSRGLPDED